MSKLQSIGLRLRVRERIKDGRLPAKVPAQVYASRGHDHMCVVCDQLITSDKVEYEVRDDRDGKRLCFHLGCHAEWHLECGHSASSDPPGQRARH